MFILNIRYYLKVFNISKGNNKIKAINKIEFNQCSGWNKNDSDLKYFYYLFPFQKFTKMKSFFTYGNF